MASARRTAGEIMDRAAVLMNDPDRTDYTYVVQMPYINMAIDELNQHLEEVNHPSTNQVFPWGTKIMPFQHTSMMNSLPIDLVEIQRVGERKWPNTATEPFKPLPRREFSAALPRTDSLQFWCLKNNHLQFNEMGATVALEVEVQYVKRPVGPVFSADQEIAMPNISPYLTYKTAAMLAMFVGENETRAEILDNQADASLERVIAIGNKGNQQLTTTRHRPFRAAWKMRGGF